MVDIFGNALFMIRFKLRNPKQVNVLQIHTIISNSTFS